MGIAAAAGVETTIPRPVGDQANKVAQSTFAAVGPGLPISLRGPVNVEIWASYASALTTTTGSGNASLGAGGVAAIGNSINSVNVPAGTTIKTIAGANITLAFPTQTWRGRLLAGSATISGLTDVNLNLATLVGATIISPFFATGTTVLAVGATAGTITTSAAPTTTPVDAEPRSFGFALTANAVQTTGADANASYTGWEIVFAGSIVLERCFDGGRTWLGANVGSSGQRAIWSAGTPVSLTFGEPEKMVLYRLNCLTFPGLAAGTTLNYRLSETAAAYESLSLASVT